jgi:hypothetical protein
MSITEETSLIELVARSNIALAQMNAAIQTLACPGIEQQEKKINIELFDEHRTIFFTAWKYRIAKTTTRRMLQILYEVEIENAKTRVNGMEHCIEIEFSRYQQGQENKLLEITESMVEALKKVSKWLYNITKD